MLRIFPFSSSGNASSTARNIPLLTGQFSHLSPFRCIDSAIQISSSLIAFVVLVLDRDVYIPILISYVSKAMAWRAGDVLVTGTPGGVGFKRNPPIFMKPGDNVEVEITDIGILSNTIKDEII